MKKSPTAEGPEKPQTQQQIQVHQGNVQVLTVQLLNDINKKLDKLIEVCSGRSK